METRPVIQRFIVCRAVGKFDVELNVECIERISFYVKILLSELKRECWFAKDVSKSAADVQ